MKKQFLRPARASLAGLDLGFPHPLLGSKGAEFDCVTRFAAVKAKSMLAAMLAFVVRQWTAGGVDLHRAGSGFAGIIAGGGELDRWGAGRTGWAGNETLRVLGASL